MTHNAKQRFSPNTLRPPQGRTIQRSARQFALLSAYKPLHKLSGDELFNEQTRQLDTSVMVQALTQVPRALGIPEIIKEIFSYHAPQAISGANAQRGYTETILAYALCCKAFSEIALDTLWYEMVDLVPLISILPGIKLLDNKLVSSGVNLR